MMQLHICVRLYAVV